MILLKVFFSIVLSLSVIFSIVRLMFDLLVLDIEFLAFGFWLLISDFWLLKFDFLLTLSLLTERGVGLTSLFVLDF